MVSFTLPDFFLTCVQGMLANYVHILLYSVPPDFGHLVDWHKGQLLCQSHLLINLSGHPQTTLLQFGELIEKGTDNSPDLFSMP